MFCYETHLHTYPVSRCAKKSVEENLLFYKEKGFDGVFITNHFLNGHINIDKTLPYEEQLRFYLSDYELGKEMGERMGIKVFFGVEMTYQRADFLIYGLSPDWYFENPGIMEMEMQSLLPFLQSQGALVIHAHPFRLWAGRPVRPVLLYPHSVQGVETFNACRTETENRLAEHYAKELGLLSFGGTDNHKGGEQKLLGGMKGLMRISDEKDFCRRVLSGHLTPFSLDLTE